MINMRSLADFKRALVIESEWLCTLKEGSPSPYWAHTETSALVRKVISTQSNAAWLTLPRGGQSRLSFGKSSEWVFKDDTATLLNNKGEPFIEYKLLSTPFGEAL
ncbi:MAG: hypothetical protein ACRCVV_21925 [Shewanella sp.]